MKLPEPIAHVHSDGEFHWNRSHHPKVWPVDFYTEEQVLAIVADLQSRAKAAEGDAGRWRWLRNAPDGLLCVRADRHKGLHNVRLTGDELDAAIDTARATQPEGESHE